MIIHAQVSMSQLRRMTISNMMKIKLVESLTRDRYLREAKQLALPTEQSGANDRDFQKLLQELAKTNKDRNDNEKRTLEDIISGSNDFKELETLVKVMLEEAGASADLSGAIVRSIIAYRSIDPKVNPIIHVYNNFEGQIDNSQLLSFFNAFKKEQPSNTIINQYFNPKTDILEKAGNSGRDLEYLVKLVTLLSDNYSAKKYSNGQRAPSIAEDLLQDGKFKNIQDIRKLMDTFTTEDSGKISLAEWAKKLGWKAGTGDKELLNILLSDKVKTPENIKDRKTYWQKVIDKFRDKTNTVYDFAKMSTGVEVDPAWDKEKDADLIAKAVFSYIQEIDRNPFKDIKLKNGPKQETIRSYLVKNNIQLTSNIVATFLKQQINKSNRKPETKNYLIQQLDNTIAKNADLFNKFIDSPLDPAAKKPAAIAQALQNFLKKIGSVTQSTIITDPNQATQMNNNKSKIILNP